MQLVRRDSPPRPLDRINLHLDPDIFEAIDLLRGKRSGNVPRNTWITEAVREKLDRETLVDALPRRHK